MNLDRFGLYTLIALNLLPFFSIRAEPCFSEKPITQSTASAGLYSNYFERDGTVSAESRRMITLADAMLSKKSEGNFFLFESQPTKYLSNYSEASICEEKSRATKTSPLKFGKFSFSSVDETVDWFSDLSQGSGEMGKKLYQLCPGKCSPRYYLVISKEDGKIVVDTTARCGHARDKDDNTYQVSLKKSRKC